MKFYKLSWQELQADCYKLAKKLKKQKFDRILCISRGGLVWARMFSDLLNLPVSHLTVVSYQDLKQQKETKITEVPATLENQNMLVVDEIADSGKTLKIVIDYLHSINIYKFKTLAPIIRKFTKPKPDIYLKIINEWVIFPYEIRETAQAFIKLFTTKDKAKKKLLEVGFENWEIDEIFQSS